MMRAVEAARRADDLQRQRAQQPQQQPLTVEQYIDTLPGLSDRKRAFLKHYPMMLEPSLTPG